MPNYRVLNLTSSDYGSTLTVRTVNVQEQENDPEDRSLIFQTTRGAQVWLGLRDIAALIDFGQAELSAWQKEGQVIGYPMCGSTSREGSLCVLIDGHEHHEFGDQVHADGFGRRWNLPDVVDAHIMCGAVYSDGVECALPDGHAPIGRGGLKDSEPLTHVTAGGLVFDD